MKSGFSKLMYKGKTVVKEHTPRVWSIINDLNNYYNEDHTFPFRTLSNLARKYHLSHQRIVQIADEFFPDRIKHTPISIPCKNCTQQTKNRAFCSRKCWYTYAQRISTGRICIDCRVPDKKIHSFGLCAACYDRYRYHSSIKGKAAHKRAEDKYLAKPGIRERMRKQQKVYRQSRIT
ncbi:hypothetical protein LCGC14_1905410 [marine sediment metagenome]|uniref:Uncharacterized protein n=1 Tax=marine sediment metagenome TaxID=412755 RepID=A0A0F9FVB4_9ZZZZ